MAVSDAPEQLDQARPDEVPDALGVRHDAGEQDARLRLVEEGDLEAADVALDAAPHLGDRVLGGPAEDLGEGKARDGLDQGRPAGGQDDPDEKLALALADDVVEQDLGRARQHQAGHAAEQQQAEAEGQASLAGVDELGGVAQDHREGMDFFFLLVVFGLGRGAPRRRSALRRARGEAPSEQSELCHGSGLSEDERPGGRARFDSIGRGSRAGRLGPRREVRADRRLGSAGSILTV